MQVHTTLVQDDLNKVAAEIRRIEEAGYTGVLTQENRHDPYLPLAVAATHSERVSLGTGVAIAFPRSPLITAQLAWDIQVASKGRFNLGIGPQVKGHNERRFSVPWSAPVPKIKEYVATIRAIWQTWKTGEMHAHTGEHYQFSLMTPNFTPEAMPYALPPITVGAVGPGMLRLAGEIGDGVRLHGFCTRKYFANVVLPELQTGFARGGTQREHFLISASGFIATGPSDQEVARQMNFIRSRVAFYGSTRAYWPVLAEHDLEDLGEKLNYMSKNSQWDRMSDEISDDVVRLFAAVGRHDEIANAVKDHFGGQMDAFSDSASYDEPGSLPPDVLQDIKAIPTDFESYQTKQEGQQN